MVPFYKLDMVSY